MKIANKLLIHHGGTYADGMCKSIPYVPRTFIES